VIEKVLNGFFTLTALMVSVMGAFVMALVSTAVMILFSLTILEYELPNSVKWSFAGFAFGFSVLELFKMMMED
jgi:hypothetical protein